MELDTVKLADLLAKECRVVLFCKWGSVIHGLYEKGRKDYAGFEQRLRPHLPRLIERGFSIYDPFANSPEVTR